MSWLYEHEGYHVFCNRDEKHHRLQATPPYLGVRNGMQYLAPVDGNAGGTWLAVNAAGLTLCLLNGNNPAPAQARSRGLLVMDWIHLPSLAAVRHHWLQADFGCYAGFTLLALADRPLVLTWDGTTKIADSHATAPLLSSSFDPENVKQQRAALFPPVVSEDTLLAFHHSHGEGRSAYTPCMHRPDAATVSFSHIRVHPGQIEFRYVAGPPCSGRVATRCWLMRQEVAA